MKRIHIHVGVENLDESIRFYSAMFGAQPVKTKPDYAKWMLEDPRVNFAISTRVAKNGVDHLGIQVDDNAELAEIRERVKAGELAVFDEGETVCCYPIRKNPGCKIPLALPGKPTAQWTMHRSFPAGRPPAQAPAARKSRPAKPRVVNRRKRRPPAAAKRVKRSEAVEHFERFERVRCGAMQVELRRSLMAEALIKDRIRATIK